MSQEPDGVPIVDIAAFLHGNVNERRAVAQRVDRTNREIGFLVITGHGFDPGLLDQWFGVSRRFFEQPLGAKLPYAPRIAGHHQGYHRMSASGLAAKEGQEAPPDLREYFMVGQLDTHASHFQDEVARQFHRPNLWPGTPDDFETLGRRYYAAMESLGATLMRVFAVALNLPEDWFTDKIDHHFSILSTIYYPAQRELPLPGQLRAGAHTDYGSLTILAPSDAPGGLQVRTRAGAWVDVPFVPGAFVVNIGDMMQRWTNDRWISNRHRVVNPPTAQRRPSVRQSIAYFLHPNHDALISCVPTCKPASEAPRHPPIRAGAFMMEKEAAIAAAKPLRSTVEGVVS